MVKRCAATRKRRRTSRRPAGTTPPACAPLSSSSIQHRQGHGGNQLAGCQCAQGWAHRPSDGGRRGIHLRHARFGDYHPRRLCAARGGAGGIHPDRRNPGGEGLYAAGMHPDALSGQRPGRRRPGICWYPTAAARCSTFPRKARHCRAFNTRNRSMAGIRWEAFCRKAAAARR